MSYAKSIFGISDKKKLVLNERVLQEIFGDKKIQNKKICVVSIAGTFRQGKSFLLNFVLRYLHLKYVRRTNARNWLNATDEPLSGFSWKCGCERHTVGILIWPEIFFAQLPNGEEVAIVVLDTQGTFDNVTSMTDCGTIFAMSSLLSSTQIYNMKEGIKQYDLSHLKCFTGYGQLLVDNSNSHPFQKLQFLIRDWQYPHEYQYGAEGGQQYLDKQLNNNSVEAEEIKALTSEIKTLYKSIKCFLLPHPGKSVAMSKTFQGELEDIDEDFQIHVEKFVPQILSPENIIINEISGSKLTVSDWLRLITSYAKQFQSGDMPPLKAIHESTAEVYYMKQVDDCVRYYENQMEQLKSPSVKSMSDEALGAIHQKWKNHILQQFRGMKQMGDSLQSKHYENQISDKIDGKYLLFIEINKLKKEKEERELMKKQLNEERRTREKERTEMQGQMQNLEQNIANEKRKQTEMKQEFNMKLHQEQLIGKKREEQMKNELNQVTARMEKENQKIRAESEREMLTMKNTYENQMGFIKDKLVTEERNRKFVEKQIEKIDLDRLQDKKNYEKREQENITNIKNLQSQLNKQSEASARNMQVLQNELNKEKQNAAKLLLEEKQQNALNRKMFEQQLNQERLQSVRNTEILKEELAQQRKTVASLTNKVNEQTAEREERVRQLEQERNVYAMYAWMKGNQSNNNRRRR